MTEKCLELMHVAAMAAGEAEGVEKGVVVAVVETKNSSDSDSNTTHAASCSDLSPDSMTSSSSSSSSSTARSLPSISVSVSTASTSTSTSTTTSWTSSSSSSSSTVLKEKLVKDEKKPLKSILKNASNKSDVKKWESALTGVKKTKKMGTNEANKDINVKVEKRRVGRPCKVKINPIVGCCTAIREGEDASSLPSKSSSPSAFSLPSPSPVHLELTFQQRIAKRKRDPSPSDSECSAESEWSVL
jgi:hypothetical protein